MILKLTLVRAKQLRVSDEKLIIHLTIHPGNKKSVYLLTLLTYLQQQQITVAQNKNIEAIYVRKN